MNRFLNHHSERWDEFRWEREMRRDELRISRYFRELPYCIDLPGEEEIIFDELMSDPSLVPSGVSPEEYRRYFSWDADSDAGDDDAGDETVPGRDEPEPDFTPALDALLTEWNFVAATRFPDEAREYAMAIACLYAKLIGRVNDAAAAPENEKALKKCLFKRALKDLNTLCAELVNIHPGLAKSADVGHALGTLQTLREKIIDRI